MPEPARSNDVAFGRDVGPVERMPFRGHDGVVY
jgi:hypothetical protein